MQHIVFVIDEAGDVHFSRVNTSGTSLSKLFARYIASDTCNVYAIRYDTAVEKNIYWMLSSNPLASFTKNKWLTYSDMEKITKDFLVWSRVINSPVSCSFSYGGLPERINILHEVFYNWVRNNGVHL